MINDILNISGKTALVTGSTQGIGRSIAEKLCRHGSHVFVNSRENNEVIKCIDELRNAGCSVDGLSGDGTIEEFVVESVKKICNERSKIDILVNNIGAYEQLEIEDISLDHWHQYIDANLTSAFLWIREVVPYMKKNGGGKIINIASIAGIIGRERNAHYNAAKGGLIAFSKGLSKDLGPFNIRINIVAPGLILTQTVQKIANGNKIFLNSNLEKTPLQRLGTPDDVANAVLFFASDLSDFITGQVLIIDGGFSST
ncbi:MAG: SDR family oxidoreductase [Parcubacteria group bacterium]|nr:SDR family oxidoreductase [Parcubacteria group bacterium]